MLRGLCLVLLLGIALGITALDTTADKPDASDSQEEPLTSETNDAEPSLDALAGKPSAYLLALKEFRSPGLFEGKQTLFFYTIFNIGQRCFIILIFLIEVEESVYIYIYI